MMQRLDNQMREGKAGGELAAKVDNALRAETVSFFSKVANLNAKRWQSINQKCEHDVQMILNDSNRNSSSSSNNHTNASNNILKSVTSLDLDLEEIRLEEDYNLHWYKYEGFHLSEAFRTQQEKLDVEWETYANQIRDAIHERRVALLNAKGIDASHLNSNSSPTNEDSSFGQKFHHPEKQKTLIHSAPVIAPKVDLLSSKSKPAAGSAIRAVRGKEDAVLQSEVLRYTHSKHLLLMYVFSFVDLINSLKIPWKH
jgi:hypothetical protein